MNCSYVHSIYCYWSINIHSDCIPNMADYETVVSQSINIEPDNLNTSITENSIYDTVKFISIDVPDSILIGEITDIKKNNDHYFALDKRK